MKLTSIFKHQGKMTALAGAFSLIVAATSQAALVVVPVVTAQVPGVPLTSSTAIAPAAPNNLGGTVVAFRSSNFAESGTPPPSFTGVLRSLVVRNPLNTLDFYYQVANGSTTPVGTGSDIYRVAVKGFTGSGLGGEPVQATFRSDGITSLNTAIIPAGQLPAFQTVGTKGVATADRDPGISLTGGVGFDFDTAHFLGGPNNVDSNQTSFWMVVRTNAQSFTDSTSTLSGAGSALNVSTFAPIPEPTTLGFGLALLGVCATSLGRSARRAQK